MTATAASDRDAAILSLEPLVTRLKSRVGYFVSQNATRDTGDLESAGWVAAIRAVDAFDATRGVPLEGFAQRMILGAMFNEVRRMDPVSERERQKVRVGRRMRFELQHELGREPSLGEIEARVPGFSRAVIRCQNHSPLSINAPLQSGVGVLADLPLEGTLAGSVDVATIVVEHEAATELRAAIESLDERRRTVIESRYFGDESLQDLARAFGVTNQRASQLHCTALAKLRGVLVVA
jgi:RNA polymerase sigma factor for flagellar operon FliA